MSRIVPNSMPAERERGCRFAETFRSEADVIRNNGEVFGAPTFDGDGVVLDGVSDYLNYSSMVPHILSRFDRLTIAFWASPAFDTDLNSTKYFFGTATGGNNYYLHKTNNSGGNTLKLVLGGTTIADIPESTYSPHWLTNQRNHFAISSDGSLTNVWLNGNKILSDDPSVWTPKTPVNFDIGADGVGFAPFSGAFYDFKVFGEALEEQEILDLYNETTYDYLNRALVYLPMQAAQDDTENYGPQLLTDGDMEAPDTSAYSPLNNATLSKVSVDPKEGIRNLRIGYNGTNNAGAFQAALVSGNTYRVTGWARSSGDATAIPRVRLGSAAVWLGTVDTFWQWIDVIGVANSSSFQLYSNLSASGYVEFDEMNVQQVIPRTLDVSGNGNHAILGDGVTPSTYPTKLPKRGYSFDGGNYARILDSQSGGHDFTTVNQCTFFILARAMGDFSGDGSLWRAVMTVAELRSEGGGGTRKVPFNIGFDQSRCSVGRGLDKLLSNYQPAQGQVVSVTGVYDGANLSIYVNGELDNSTASTGDEFVGTGAANYFVGSRTLDSGDPGSYLTGNLLAHACWGYALTPMQVADLHINMIKSINRV